MRRLPVPAGVFAGLALGACSAAPVPGGGPDRASAEAACAAATAAHVDKPVAAVAATWSHSAADGGGVVTVTDPSAAGGERVHVCTVRLDGSVASLVHA